VCVTSQAVVSFPAGTIPGLLSDWPLQEIILLRVFGARINHPFITTLPALPTLLQYYCTTNASCSPPPPTTLFVCHTVYNIGHGNSVQRHPFGGVPPPLPRLG